MTLEILNLITSLDQAGFAIFAKDRESRYLDINSSGATMLGSDPFSMRGRDDFEFFDETSAKMIRARDEELITSRKGRTFDSLARADGRWNLFHTTKSILFDERGVATGLVGLSGNVSGGHAHCDPELFRAASEILLRDPDLFLKTYRTYVQRAESLRASPR